MPIRQRLKRFQGRLIGTWFPTNAALPSTTPANLEEPGTAVPPSVFSNTGPATTSSPHLDVDSSRQVPASSAPSNQPVAPSTGTENDGADSWPKLKSFLRMLDQGPIVFGPLKVVTCGLVECIEIYEKAVDNRKEYNKLRTELENLFETLEQFFTQPDSLIMTTSMESLCKSIQKELDYIRGKQVTKTEENYLRARDDSEEVLACYQRIQIYLQRLSLNVDLSMWKIMDEQVTDSRLSRLCSSMSACYNSSQAAELKRGACTPGTRIDVLGQMHSWICSPTTGCVYWLNGMAGTGKTTIAYTLCSELDAFCQLGASFFCSRALPECRDVNKIVPSIAYQLARFSRPFRSALSHVLEKDPDVHTRLLRIQFETLIVKPLITVQKTLPEDLVVVIDALDECDNQQSTGLILDALFTKVTNLPIKFFISSRPEPEIRDQMQKQGDHQKSSRLVLHELDEGTVQGDIETYLRQALAPIQPTEPQIRTLVQRAGILFIYAATVVRYIGLKNFRQNPRARLETILNVSITAGDNPYKDIDELYTLILKAAIDDPDLNEAERSDIKQVLYTAVCAREPLTICALSGLLGLNNVERVNVALQPLWSVLHVVQTSGIVTTLHASFPDYMFDSRRSKEYHCDSTAHNHILAQCCFERINGSELRFNICGLESSYMPDSGIPDLNTRVEKAIASELSYACRYWASHLEPSEESPEIVAQLQDFLSTRLLLWMEVMNLKNCMHSGVGVIQQAEKWCIDHGCSKELMKLIHDSWRFVAAFTSSAVSQSTPHIYVSMLPFWPESNPIARHYGEDMRVSMVPQGHAIAQRRLELLATWSVDGEVDGCAWSPNSAQIALAAGGKIFVLDGLTGRILLGPLKQTTDSVRSVGYSWDGARIVSGSKDGTIRVWDAESGKKVVGPLRAHRNAVTSVAFSPDGASVVSGSSGRTTCVWDIQSGRTVLGPLKGHTGSVTSVAFSPRGTHVASASVDGTIRVSDMQGSQMVLGPVAFLPQNTRDGGRPYSINSVAFSPDGTRIISGLDDGSIYLWDIKSGEKVLGPLKGHASSIRSVGFSPDGTRIVSSSDDTTIAVWDTQSGEVVLGPLEGHTRSVISAGFSPDNTRILSGSSDRTIRLWDVRGRQTRFGQPEGHTAPIHSVGFSPSGTYIVSGSSDQSIRVWDIQTGWMVLGPLEGHTGPITSVSFSPDSTRIVSSSNDKTIRVWDIISGQVVLGPLRGHTSFVTVVSVSPNGAVIASGSHDTTIRVWDMQSGQTVLGPLKGHTNRVTSVGFSSAGSRVVSGSDDNTIRVWDMQSGETVLGPLQGHTSLVSSVGFSPDDTRIISGSYDQVIMVWDAQSGQMVTGPLKGHTGPVTSVGFSPDGTCIVSGSRDKTMRVWDVASGRMVLDPLEGHTKSVTSVGFSPDGTRIVSGSDDKTIRVWDIRSRHTVESSRSAPTFLDWKIDSSGWVTDNQSRLLVWVPPDLRDALQSPVIVFDTSPDHVCLNFDNVRIGESWTECYHVI